MSRPTPRPWPDAQRQARRALLGRRQPRSGMRPAAHNRLAGPCARLLKAIEAHLTGRKARSAPLDAAREALRRASPLWRANAARGPRAPGLGPGCARTLWLARPEVGARTRQQSAALVGVAPLHGDRGTRRGRRTNWGGRAQGRTVLAMGLLVAPRFHPRLKAFDERLRAAGQGKKAALTACRRKFLTVRNAMLKQRTPWQVQVVQS